MDLDELADEAAEGSEGEANSDVFAFAEFADGGDDDVVDGEEGGCGDWDAACNPAPEKFTCLIGVGSSTPNIASKDADDGDWGCLEEVGSGGTEGNGEDCAGVAFEGGWWGVVEGGVEEFADAVYFAVELEAGEAVATAETVAGYDVGGRGIPLVSLWLGDGLPTKASGLHFGKL